MDNSPGHVQNLNDSLQALEVVGTNRGIYKNGERANDLDQ